MRISDWSSDVCSSDLAILDHPSIKAVSFVGSSDVAHYVYCRGTAAGKRMQCMGGAKNHGIVMTDADLDRAVADIVGAAYGSAGERSKALPVVVPVGEDTARNLRHRLVTDIARVRGGMPTDHIGTAASRERVWP